MGFIGSIIILIIIFCIWDGLKRVFTHDQKSNTYHSDHILVTCPHCHTNLQISGEGLWNCSNCEHTFEYQGGYVSKYDSTIPTVPKLLVELFAKVAKADGIVTKEEIRKVDEIIQKELQPNAETMAEIRKIFNHAKTNSSGYQVIIHKLYDLLHEQPDVLMSIVQCLHVISKIDYSVSAEQESIIIYAANSFHLSAYYEEIKGRSENSLAKYYNVLGCNYEDSLDKIKRKYRTLLKEYHPDKFASQNLPQDLIQLANKRVQEIQEAYEKVVKYKTVN